MSVILNKLSDKRLIDLLQQGKVGVLPTDTVYGLVCVASNPTAVERLYSLKQRERKPGTVIAASLDQLVALGLKARYLKAVEHYWPNPISIVIPSYELGYIHQGIGSIATRIPADKDLRQLLEQTGPLLTSSANQPGETPANTLAEAQDYFGDSINFYVDGGNLSGRESSTVIRIVDDMVEVLREGAVIIDENGSIR
jgi:tRNA threonylcarbamoyl adenosine modification protein (Sua5/YciO/YrdC/YwlC family)